MYTLSACTLYSVAPCLITEKSKNREAADYPSCQIGGQRGGDSVARFLDLDRREVDCDGIERRLRRAYQHRRDAFRERIRADCRSDLVVHRHRAAARKRAQNHQWDDLGRKPDRIAKRSQKRCQCLDRAARTEHSDTHEQQHQRRQDIHTGLQPVRGALAERLKHVNTLDRGVNKHRHRYQRDYPIGKICQCSPLFRATLPMIFAASTATTAAYTDTIHTHGRISNGFSAPFAVRRAAAVAGITCRLAVLRTARSIILSVAYPSACSMSDNSRIAAIPRGVDAFPRPSIFAARFIVISPTALLPLGTPRNSAHTTGDSNRASFSVSPARSATLISPHQKHIIPHNEITSSTASPDLEIMPAESSDILPLNAAKISDIMGITTIITFIFQ